MCFRRYSVVALAATLLVSNGCSSPAVRGDRWEGEFDSQIGMQKYSFILDFRGSTITGQITSPRGTSDVREGKRVGDNVSFVETMIDDDGKSVEVQYSGKIDGDQMKLVRIPGIYLKGTAVVRKDVDGLMASLLRKLGLSVNSKPIVGASQPTRAPLP